MNLLTDHPQFQTAQAAYTELAELLSKVQAKHNEVLAALREERTGEDADLGHIDAAQQFAETGRVHGPTADLSALREQEVLLRQQVEALKKAMGAQWQEIQRVTADLSQSAWLELEPEHKALAARYAAGMRELDAIAEAEQQLLARANRGGFDVRPRQRVAWFFVGRLTDPQNTPSRTHLAELDCYAK